MVIEINKNIDNYKESVVLGLTARQLVYSALSVVVGGGIVLLLYRHVGLTVSTYIAVPVIAPIAMTGFYSYHGMTFIEMMKLKLYFAFANRTYTYMSTEGEQAVQRLRQEEETKNKAGKKSSTGKKGDNGRGDFAAVRKKMIHMLILTVLFLIVFMGFAVWYKYRQ